MLHPACLKADIAEKQRAYYESNKAEIAEKKRAYYESNKAEIAEKKRAYDESKTGRPVIRARPCEACGTIFDAYTGRGPRKFCEACR